MLCSTHAITVEVESFTIDSITNAKDSYHVYNRVLSAIYIFAMRKEVEKVLSGRHPAAAKPAELYTL